MPKVNHEILRWARDTAGLTLEDAAKSLQLGGKRRSGTDLLQQYEEGNLEPSRPLLLRMTKAYRRPLLTFYLPAPPKKADRGEDFRTLPEERQIEDYAKLDALVRDLHVRQRLVRAAIEDADEANPLRYVGSLTLNQNITEVVPRIRQFLSFDLAEFRRKRTVSDAFAYLRSLVEAQGTFVVLIGNLGSHHSNLSAEIFRGFALSDQVAPFIVINDQDAKSAWAFTLLHELVHIFLGITGISGGSNERSVEKFCNDVASQFLLPSEELNQWAFNSNEAAELVAQIDEFARARRISRSLVCYRLYQAGRISQKTWGELVATFYKMWLAERAAERKKNGDNNGPSYFIVRRHRVGGALIDFVRRTLADGTLTPTKAGKVLGVKPVNVEPLLGLVPA